MNHNFSTKELDFCLEFYLFEIENRFFFSLILIGKN